MAVYARETDGLRVDGLHPPLSEDELRRLPEAVVAQINNFWTKGEPVPANLFEGEGAPVLRSLRELFASKIKAILERDECNGRIFKNLSKLTHAALLTGVVRRRRVSYKEEQINYRNPSTKEFIEELDRECGQGLMESYERVRVKDRTLKSDWFLKKNEDCDINTAVEGVMAMIPDTRDEIKKAVLSETIVPKNIFKKLRELALLARFRNSDQVKVGDLLSVNHEFVTKYEFLRLTYAEIVSDQKFAMQREEEV